MACTVIGLALLVGRGREVAYGVDVSTDEASSSRSSLVHALAPVLLPAFGWASQQLGGGSVWAIITAFVVFHLLGPTPSGSLQACLKDCR